MQYCFGIDRYGGGGYHLAQIGLILLFFDFCGIFDRKMHKKEPSRVCFTALIISYILKEVFTKNAKMGHFLVL
jgi:hypothetical protein